MRRLWQIRKRFVPLWVCISLLITVISLVVYRFAINIEEFADFVNLTVSSALRAALSSLTYILPFSVFELLLILIIPIVVALIIIALKKYGDVAGRVKFLCSIIGVLSLVATSYIYTLGIGYHTTPISEKLSLDTDGEITTDELYSTLELVINEINKNSELIKYSDGESRMEYGMSELSEKIVDAYDKAREKYPFFVNFSSRAKPVLFSTVMSDAGITGIYSFFTGEPNINMDYPDYSLPFTVAHEFAHQRGICREDEANFMAFLVCVSSSDPYIRYSGYLNLYGYLAGSLYRADSEKYKELSLMLLDNAQLDRAAYSEVSRAHSDSWFNKLSDRLNDSYLKFNGTEGVISYSYVVRLAVAYYRT